jgi:hypothetical protein
MGGKRTITSRPTSSLNVLEAEYETETQNRTSVKRTKRNIKTFSLSLDGRGWG